VSVNSDKLKAIANEYKLTVNGVSFWTPYFLNTPKAFGAIKAPNLPAPHLGKGTPDQIKNSLHELIKAQQPELRDEHDYRRFMHENRLGVECSGFIYYLLNTYLEEAGKESLDHYLYWSREELLAAYDAGTPWHRPELERSVVEGYPDIVSLEVVKKDWGWDTPAKLVNVRRLVNSMAATAFDDVAKLQPGDMIFETGHDSVAHAMVVVEVGDSQIVYVHSGGVDRGKGDDNFFGGVEYGSITITDPAKTIEHQDWEDQAFLELHSFESGALRRLKVLNEL